MYTIRTFVFSEIFLILALIIAISSFATDASPERRELLPGYGHFIKCSYFDKVKKRGLSCCIFKGYDRSKNFNRPYMFCKRDRINKDIIWMAPLLSLDVSEETVIPGMIKTVYNDRITFINLNFIIPVAEKFLAKPYRKISDEQIEELAITSNEFILQKLREKNSKLLELKKFIMTQVSSDTPITAKKSRDGWAKIKPHKKYKIKKKDVVKTASDDRITYNT